MDNDIKTSIRFLEVQNETKAEELTRTYQRITDLETQVADLTNSDSTYVSPEAQVDFIRKIAESSSKFAKEAQDIIDAIDNPATQDSGQ